MPQCMQEVQGLPGNPQHQRQLNLDKKQPRNKAKGKDNSNFILMNLKPAFWLVLASLYTLIRGTCCIIQDY